MVHTKTGRVSPPRPPSHVNGVGASQWLAVGLAAAVSLAALAGVASVYLEVFDFRFNSYALLPLAGALIGLVLLVLMGRVATKTDELVWFSLYVLCLIFWAVVEFFIQISVSAEAMLLWWPMPTLPLVLMPALLFMFVLAHTRQRQARQVWTVASLFGAALLLAFLNYKTSAMGHYSVADIISAPWSGATMTGSYYGIVVLWTLGLTALSIAMLVGSYRRPQTPELKQQAGLFMASLLGPVVTTLVAGGVLAVFGVFDTVPLAVFFTALAAAAIAYGILRYRRLMLDSSVVAARILETINEAVVGVKPDLGVMYANKGAERLLGYGAQQFAHMRFMELLNEPWNARALKKALLEAASGRMGGELDSVELRTAAGTVLPAKLSVSSASEEGVLGGYLVVLTDVSHLVRERETIERTVQQRTREAQEAKASLVASINSLKMGFIITNDRPEIIRVNTVAHDLFCSSFRTHTAGECENVSLSVVQGLMGEPLSLAGDIKTCLRKQLPHEVKDVVFANRNWRLYLSPMVVDRVSIGCAVLFQDTTEERQLERSRDEFFSIASHELRTPLTSIKGNSSLILQFYPKILEDKTLNEMVTDIHDSSGRLIEIVNDFLDVSRLELGRIEFHPEQLPVSKVIEEVVYGMSALFKEKKLQVKLSGNIKQRGVLPDVIVDKNRLKQVLFNLMGNAVKFTPKGSIAIEAEQERDSIKIRVRDTGAGISPESQALLFRKFQQVGDRVLTRDSSNGSGLGLYISRLLANGMGGELGLEESVLGKGSVFFVRVPVATPARLKRLSAATPTVEHKESK